MSQVWSGARGSRGARVHPVAQEPPAPLRLPSEKVDPGLPEHLFLKRLQECGVFCAIFVYKCW